MKKLLVASVLALSLTMASQQRASAWKEFQFSAGISFHYCGGGNRWLWGLYESSPYPGVPNFGPPCAGYGGPVYGPFASVDAPAASVPAAAAPAASAYVANPYTNSGYQPVGYYYPQQSPSYWYGR